MRAPAAERPAPLLEVLPQEWVQRRTVEQIVDPVPVVPMLHGFVLRTLLRRWQAHGRDAAGLHVGALAAGEDGAARRHRV